MGRQQGVSDEQLLSLADYRESPAFSEEERLVLDFASELCQTHVKVPDELYAALHERFTEPQLVELTAAIAWENFRSRFNRAFEISADGFSEGAACALPAQHRALIAESGQ